MADQSQAQDRMSIPTPGNYSQQANPAFEAALTARTALRETAFLVPHLGAGMHVLDVGCGPRTITLGLAEIIAPGLVIGIDISPELN